MNFLNTHHLPQRQKKFLNRLLIATTVPETLAYILREQPRYLNNHFDVNVVTSDGPEIKLIADEGVSLHLVPMRRRINPIQDLVSVWDMVRLFRQVRPHIVHSYTPKAGLVCMLASWICRVPFRVHTFTGLVWSTEYGFKKKLLMAVDRLLCACATHIVPESLGVRRDLQRFRITTKPLKIIGNGNIAGVDIEYFSPAAGGVAQAAIELGQRCSFQPDDFVYVFVGRLNRDKGVVELLAAFDQLPQNCQLLILGSLDKTAPVNEKVLHQINSHERVHWLGFQPDIRPALQAADVFVLPSYREGFPNTVLQAGAMELPVVATDISGCNEVIEDELNGWLIPTHDTKALAEAMRVALVTPKVRLHDMGKIARERIVERFERVEHWKRMVAFYQALIATER